MANHVSHSNIKTKRVQLPNLRTKKLWSEEQQQFVRVRLSARALRSVTKKGLDAFLRDAGMTLRDLAR